MPATIKDIAKKIGKSTTTVSRALNDFDDISPETKDLVRQAAEDLGYIPNIMAQRLQKRQTDTIGLIVPTSGPRFSDPFFSEFIAGIGNKAAQMGYDLLVSTREPGDQELEAYRHNIRSHRVDGFIVVRTRRQDARINLLRKIGFPFAAFGRTDGDLDFPYVDEDGELGMKLVIDYLAKLGHKRMGVIAPPGDLEFSRYRLNGIRAKFVELGLAEKDLIVVQGDLTQRSGYEQANNLLDMPNPPTAIAACNDLMAFGAMSAAQMRGLVVGRDLSITGFDNIPMTEHSHPPLTTVNQPIYQIGSMVCEMLVKRICGEAADLEQVLLTPSLIVRQSCGPAPLA
ncbi:MAG: LacI family DNA-binding transcriptional regulator [Chloroflexi bacterium]|nr:LacI family DNA-binding transcriptional regulator [Chloroflexota bacterium]